MLVPSDVELAQALRAVQMADPFVQEDDLVGTEGKEGGEQSKQSLADATTLFFFFFQPGRSLASAQRALEPNQGACERVPQAI